MISPYPIPRNPIPTPIPPLEREGEIIHFSSFKGETSEGDG
jgi:hypothetical protein